MPAGILVAGALKMRSAIRTELRVPFRLVALSPFTILLWLVSWPIESGPSYPAKLGASPSAFELPLRQKAGIPGGCRSAGSPQPPVRRRGACLGFDVCHVSSQPRRRTARRGRVTITRNRSLPFPSHHRLLRASNAGSPFRERSLSSSRSDITTPRKPPLLMMSS